MSEPLLALGGLCLGLIAALAVDWRLHKTGIAPSWWLSLRVPLSLGLGGITLAIGLA